MTTEKCKSLSETRIEEHLSLLKELDTNPFADSCCHICHCECYNTHRNEDDGCCIVQQAIKDEKALADNSPQLLENTKIKKKNNGASNPTLLNIATKSTQLYNGITLPTENLNNKNTKDANLRKKRKARKCSEKVSLQRSQSQCSERHYTRDCEVLQDLLTSLDDKYLTSLQVIGNSKNVKRDMLEKDKYQMIRTSRSPTSLLLSQNHHSLSYLHDTESKFVPVRLSESMANLCLAPTIKKAYNKVPDHDKRILNRMATKRSEQALATENAWLARKYWENERYERELLKCEQMEEYKKAVRDKQFQDYLRTKARLNEIAQRDLAELQRLRESLQQKDDRVKKRLQGLRIERDCSVNQKRSEGMRKMECVNLHQEEQNLDEMIRKNEICHRLTKRLQRADHIRNKMLENYLKRLQYDNYIEQLQHEEQLREVQLNEQLKHKQLKEQISRKRCRSQHFVETKQQRNESIRKTSKLSKSLRDIVRSSVSPEAGVMLFGTGRPNNVAVSDQNSLSKLLLSRPF